MIKKGHRLWNVIIVLTIVFCLMVFIAHFKNWVKEDQDGIKLLSGFYYKELKYSELDSVLMVEKMPPMVRLNGFSAFEKEKGLFQDFKDSLTDKKVHVYVDNISHQKIKLVYNDSSKIYFNYADSLKTEAIFKNLKAKMELTN